MYRFLGLLQSNLAACSVNGVSMTNDSNSSTIFGLLSVLIKATCSAKSFTLIGLHPEFSAVRYGT